MLRVLQSFAKYDFFQIPPRANVKTFLRYVGVFSKFFPLGIFSILYISILNLRTFKVNGNTPSDRQLSNLSGYTGAFLLPPMINKLD